MALIAIRRADDVARRRRASSGNKVEGGVSVVGTQIEFGEIPGTIDPDAVCSSGIEPRRGLRRECVVYSPVDTVWCTPESAAACVAMAPEER